MSVSNLSPLDRGVSLRGVTPGPLQRAKEDFAQQMQSALDALEARSPEAHEAVAPVLTQVSQAVDAVFNQLQVNLAGPSSAVPSSAVSQPPSAVSSVASETSATQAPVSDARDYLLPGEPGAGLPANYLKSPLYQAWLAQKPSMGENVTEFGQALMAWQKANPYYVDPDRFETFEGYLSAVESSTKSGNLPAQADPTRYTSFLSSYYGPSATANPWGERLGQVKPQEMVEWTDGLRAQYEHALAAQRSLQALEASGLLGSGNT